MFPAPGRPVKSQPERSFKVSLISRLRAVVAGDDYLDGDLDDLVYDDDQPEQDQRASQADGGALATIGDSNPFDLGGLADDATSDSTALIRVLRSLYHHFTITLQSITSASVCIASDHK